MKRLFFALSLSLSVHLLLGVFVYGIWQMKELRKTTHTSLHAVVFTYAPKQASEPNLLPHQEAPIQEKPLPSLPSLPPIAKQEKKVEKPRIKDPSSTKPTSSNMVDNNATITSNQPLVASASVDVSPKNVLPDVLPEAPKPSSYIEAHRVEILQALNDAKEYPEVARKRSIEGVVELSFTLKPDGEVEGVDAHASSQILGNSAIATLHKAKHLFPKSDENVTLKVPIIYRLT